MQYLVGQMLTFLLVGGLLGVVIGWIWWGMRLRQWRDRASELEQKLSGYPARLTNLEETHAAFVASKNEEEAKYKLRIAELEPLAKTPELEKELAAKTVECEGLQTQITGKTSELVALQAKLSDLQAQHKTVSATADQVPLLTSWLGDLEGMVKSKDAEIAEHVQAHADKDVRLMTLTGRVAELEPAAKRVPLLEAQILQHVDAHRETDEHLEQFVGQVKQHATAHAGKDARIAELLPLEALVPVLKAELETKDAHAVGLKAQVEQHAAALAEKDAQVEHLTAQVERPPAVAPAETEEHIAELVAAAALVPELKAQIEQHVAAHAEKDTQIGALLSRVEELQPLVPTNADLQSRVESAEYESTVATRKWRMAESAVAAHQNEVVQLHDQVLMHKAELASFKKALGNAEPLKAMAAAAGAGAAAVRFYDVNEGAASTTAPTPVAPDHVQEFEKRIDELRAMESAKDDEIAKIRKKMADVEAAPDPDMKRQILFAAKNAELTHLRGVLNSLLQPVSQEEIAQRAFSYAKDRNFNGGSPTEDWLRAERDVHYGRLSYAWESTRSGTMY